MICRRIAPESGALHTLKIMQTLFKEKASKGMCLMIPIHLSESLLLADSACEAACTAAQATSLTQNNTCAGQTPYLGLVALSTTSCCSSRLGRVACLSIVAWLPCTVCLHQRAAAVGLTRAGGSHSPLPPPRLTPGGRQHADLPRKSQFHEQLHHSTQKHLLAAYGWAGSLASSLRLPACLRLSQQACYSHWPAMEAGVRNHLPPSVHRSAL